MLAATEVTHLGPLFEASRALNLWIASHCPDSLYAGTFWILCLAPLFLLILLVALRPPRRPLFLTLLLAALLLARLPLLCYDHFNPDEAWTLSMAMRVPADPVPYRSFEPSTSGPLNVYLQAIPAWFGLPLTYVSSRLIGITLVFGTLAFLWLGYRRFLTERLAGLALMPAFCFYLFAWDSDFAHCSSEHLAVLLGAAAVYLLARDFQAGSSTALFRTGALGVLAGSMGFAKLQAVPVAAAVLLLAVLVAWHKSRPAAAVAALAGGAALIPAAFLTLFLRFGVLRDFWICYFQANAAYTQVTALSPYHKISGAFELLFGISNMGAYVWGLLPVFVAALAAAIALYRGRRRPAAPGLHGPVRLTAASAVLLAAGFTSVAAPGRQFMHYLLFLVVPLGVSTASALLWIHSFLRTRTWKYGAPIGVACFLCATCILPTAARDHIDDAWDAGPFSPGEPLPAAIRQYASQYDHIVVWGWRAELYVATRRVSATRFPNSAAQFDPSPYLSYFRGLYMEDFRRSKPAVFVDAVGPGDFTYTDRSVAGYETFEELRQAVARDYRQAAEIDGARLFVRNGRLPAADH
ncbi:MAG: hypothetical protein ABSF62_09160 [Bryobacteraceae bacterium]